MARMRGDTVGRADIVGEYAETSAVEPMSAVLKSICPVEKEYKQIEINPGRPSLGRADPAHRGIGISYRSCIVLAPTAAEWHRHLHGTTTPRACKQGFLDFGRLLLSHTDEGNSNHSLHRGAESRRK